MQGNCKENKMVFWKTNFPGNRKKKLGKKWETQYIPESKSDPGSSRKFFNIIRSTILTYEIKSTLSLY